MLTILDSRLIIPYAILITGFIGYCIYYLNFIIPNTDYSNNNVITSPNEDRLFCIILIFVVPILICVVPKSLMFLITMAVTFLL